MNTQNLTKIVKGLVLATALVSSLVACGKKGDDNNNLNAFTATNRDPDINGQPFFETTTRAYSANSWSYSTFLTINWRFAGQNINPQAPQQNNSSSTTYPGYNTGYYSPAMTYVGKVAAIGRLDINGPLNLYFCGNVPAGSYEIQTQDVGRWNQGQISGLRLVMRGPVTFTAVLYNARAYDYSGYYYGGASTSSRYIEGTFRIEQVNGYYCQGADYTMYNPYYYGGYRPY